MKLPRAFKKLRKLKEMAKIKDFSISFASLEEIFIKMAQERRQLTFADTILENL